MSEVANESRILDIIVKKDDSNQKFNHYAKKDDIGKKIYKSFINLWKKNKGVSLTGKEEGKYGTISNIMALSSMLEFDSMGVDISKDIDKLHFLIESVFAAVYQGVQPVFDASPYFFNTEEYVIDSYVETASKICITMIDLRKYAISHSLNGDEWVGNLTINRREIHSFDDLARNAEQLFAKSLNALIQSCLPTREHERRDYTIGGKKVNRAGLDSIITHRGWNFQDPGNDADQYGVSIYYTYHATNAYVSIYNAFKDFLTENFFEGKLDSNFEKTLTSDEKKRYDLDLAFLIEHRDKIRTFRKMCASTGRYLDTMLQQKDINLSFDYIRNGFSKVSASQILESQKNNYVMETLFVIAILMNAGVDEDYENKEIGQNEYIYNQILYSLTNIKKIYNVLRKNNREDLVDSYVLSAALFTEKVPSKLSDLVRKFRMSCEGISTIDLVPLLCNTYSIVFSFLIKYPNKDMIDNLELIMENRAPGDNWYWDIDGFNINNNLYYIVALENFYDYYEEYELPYTQLGATYNKVASDARAIIKQKDMDLQEAAGKIAELEQKLVDKASKLDQEVAAIATNIFNKNFEARLTDYFNGMIDDCILLSLSYLQGSDYYELVEKHPRAEILLRLASADSYTDMLKRKAGSYGRYPEEILAKTKDEIKTKISDLLEKQKNRLDTKE